MQSQQKAANRWYRAQERSPGGGLHYAAWNNDVPRVMKMMKSVPPEVPSWSSGPPPDVVEDAFIAALNNTSYDVISYMMSRNLFHHTEEILCVAASCCKRLDVFLELFEQFNRRLTRETIESIVFSIFLRCECSGDDAIYFGDCLEVFKQHSEMAHELKTALTLQANGHYKQFQD